MSIVCREQISYQQECCDEGGCVKGCEPIAVGNLEGKGATLGQAMAELESRYQTLKATITSPACSLPSFVPRFLSIFCDPTFIKREQIVCKVETSK